MFIYLFLDCCYKNVTFSYYFNIRFSSCMDHLFVNWLFQYRLKGNFMVYRIYIWVFNEENILFSNTWNRESFIIFLFSISNITCISSSEPWIHLSIKLLPFYTWEIRIFATQKSTCTDLGGDFIFSESKWYTLTTLLFLNCAIVYIWKYSNRIILFCDLG